MKLLDWEYCILKKLPLMHCKFILKRFNTSRYTGQVGYLHCSMRSTKEARIGDTLYKSGSPVEPLPGFKPSKPMVLSLISSYFQGLCRNLSCRTKGI